MSGRKTKCRTPQQILYQAALRDDWGAAEPILEKDLSLARAKMTERGERVLHIAAVARSTRFVEELVNKMEESDLELPNNGGTNAFCFAAASGVVKIASIMRDKNKKLPNIFSRHGSAITMAASLGHKDMVVYLYEVTDLAALDNLERFELLEATIQHELYDVALDIFKKDTALATTIVEGDRSLLHALSKKALTISWRDPDGKWKRFVHMLNAGSMRVCSPVRRIFISMISRMPFITRFERVWVIRGKSLLKKQAGVLLEELWAECLQLPEDKLARLISKTQIMNSAAKAGNVEFLAVLIRDHPDLIWKVDRRKRTIFHVAALHRQEKVYSLIHQIGAVKDLITLYVDVDGNNILHLAGKLGQPIPLKQKIGQQFGEIEELKQKLGQPMPCNDIILESIKQLLEEILQQRLAEQTPANIEYEEALQQLITEIDQKIGQPSPCNIIMRKALQKLIREIEAIKKLAETLCFKEEEKIMPPSFLRVSGAALRLQREILWFKEVEKIVPPSFLRMENNDEKTPRQLFSEEHKLLLKEGERWMRDTANYCMIVATLIATVMFAAAFTLPGGNDDNEGTPIMLKLKGFSVFVISDAVAMFCSIVSIIMFLSILTSRYNEDDFVVSLPKKLLFGLTTLFASIVGMLVAFAATFFLVYNNHMAWQPKLIAAISGVPIALFGCLHYKLWWDTVKSTYWSKFLFKPGKHRLY
ncbi:PREDICTED: uncharacterized protein LOC109244405 isoform X2 [Nicotiana attenuata]|uniref:uncharacterized protein LOC109244405 isoform X2 n=1 Tax=Nicotiana attenuata TaxID=49451 RepID=UPI0009048B9F|nr:PREDICTED: uncharacterized protein LOC109244405 isoform X2 [Nicotiana attenuata]